MTDVRLTATNPDDSSVVPVACNAKGELKLEDIPTFDGNLQGDLTVSGKAEFNSDVYVGDPGANWASAKLGVRRDSENWALSVATGSAVSNPVGVLVACGAAAPSSAAFKIESTHPALGGGGKQDACNINYNGTASFSGDVVIGSRGSKWMIVESGGLAHLIAQTSFEGESRDEYPQLRNIPNELTMVEQALGEVMEKLRMVPPAGWEVWDGSSEES